MSSLRRLILGVSIQDLSILDGCTFKLDTFSCDCPHSGPLRRFINSQPNLTDITLHTPLNHLPKTLPFKETCFPNLTRIRTEPFWLSILIPGRPVREVTVHRSWRTYSFDFSFFALSTAPIQKLNIPYNILSREPVSLLASIFPSLVHLILDATCCSVRITPSYR